MVVPAYNRFAFKAIESEGKVMLASIYNAEKAFYTEYGKYHISFQALGFSPESGIRYNAGFSVPGDSAGPEVGFYTSVDTAKSTRRYCDGTAVGLAAGSAGNSCRLIAGIDGQAPPTFASTDFTVTETTFAVGAQIMKPLNLASLVVEPEFDHMVAFGNWGPLSPIASALALHTLSIDNANAAPPPQTDSACPVLQVIIINEQKILTTKSQGDCPFRSFYDPQTGLCSIPPHALALDAE